MPRWIYAFALVASCGGKTYSNARHAASEKVGVRQDAACK